MSMDQSSYKVTGLHGLQGGHGGGDLSHRLQDFTDGEWWGGGILILDS